MINRKSGTPNEKRRQAAARQMVEIINRQRRHKLRANTWLDLAKRALAVVNTDKSSVTIVFVSDASIRKLNQQFRGKDYPTDVLSFPTQAEAFESDNQTQLGEIIISIDRAAAQARDNGLTLDNEIQQLILHGLLHLCGYDHETDNGEMNRLELKLRRKLRI